MEHLLALLLVISRMTSYADAYSSGAPVAACGDMTPRHTNAVNQFSINNPSPYVLEVPQFVTYSANSQIQGQLKVT